MFVICDTIWSLTDDSFCDEALKALKTSVATVGKCIESPRQKVDKACQRELDGSARQ